MSSKQIGVLALQGAFAKHAAMIRHLGAIPQEVRKPEHLEQCDGLIIPGGESTTLTKLLEYSGLQQSIVEFAREHSVMGTCAGLILMASSVLELRTTTAEDENVFLSSAKVSTLNLLDITVLRNAYGRQIESFETELSLTLTLPHLNVVNIPAFFIRAPKIHQYAENVKILAWLNGSPVVVQQGRHLGLTFHPELTNDCTLHRYWLESCLEPCLES